MVPEETEQATSETKESAKAKKGGRGGKGKALASKQKKMAQLEKITPPADEESEVSDESEKVKTDERVLEPGEAPAGGEVEVKKDEAVPEKSEAVTEVESKDSEGEAEAEPAKQSPVEIKAKEEKEKPGDWVPRTRLGLMVKRGEIATMGEALKTGYPLREPEVVDILLPDLDDEVLDVNMVQRMTDSGRRVRFAIITVVGNNNGYVGLGKATGKEVGPAIRKSIDNAKLNIIEIKRGCGSWECGCGEPHSLPFMVRGKSGSAIVQFKPAPRGIDLAVGDVAKHILRLAGIEDAWGFTSGKTRTTVNYAKAAFDALKRISEMRIRTEQEVRLHIHTGGIIQDGGGEGE